MDERTFQKQVEKFLTEHGWDWVHFRLERTRSGQPPVATGPLARGWPDLLAIRNGDMVFAELKTDTGALTVAQREMIARLERRHRYEVFSDVWRPAKWAEIQEDLR